MAARTSTKTAKLTQAIAERAHELYLLRGCEHGHDLDDWLIAESEVRAVKPKKRASARKVEDQSAA
jgi:hypothetical protein